MNVLPRIIRERPGTTLAGCLIVGLVGSQLIHLPPRLSHSSIVYKSYASNGRGSIEFIDQGDGGDTVDFIVTDPARPNDDPIGVCPVPPRANWPDIVIWSRDGSVVALRRVEVVPGEPVYVAAYDFKRHHVWQGDPSRSEPERRCNERQAMSASRPDAISRHVVARSAPLPVFP